MRRLAFYTVMLILAMNGCVAPLPSPVSTPVPILTATEPIGAPTQTPILGPKQDPTFSPSPTSNPTPPTYLTALVWEQDPQVPILVYHNFLLDRYAQSSATKMRLSDLRSQLQQYYDAGFSLVSFENWLAGDLRVPPGRRPLIINIDDAFFAQQIFLTPDGRISPDTGIGTIWQFSQDHPDFGFTLLVSAVLGDKYYANIQTRRWWQVGPGWEDALAHVIVWCLEHNITIANHTYTHALLDRTKSAYIPGVLAKNDRALRRLLARARRADLDAELPNLIALPQGLRPSERGGEMALRSYLNPEGKPVGAILESGYDLRFLPPPYSSTFDRMRIPRLMAGVHFPIQAVLADLSRFPTAQECRLGPVDPTSLQETGAIEALIQGAIFSGACPEGVFVVEGRLIRASPDGVKNLSLTPR